MSRQDHKKTMGNSVMTTPSLSPIFQQYSSLFVQQRKEWAEILIDWETSNKYAVLDEQKNEVGWIAERSGGIGTQIKRWFLRSHRGFFVDVFDREKNKSSNFGALSFFFFQICKWLSPTVIG